MRRPPASTGSGPHTGQAAGAAVLSWTASAPRYTTPRLWRADGTASTRVLTEGLMTVTEPVVRIIVKTSFSISGRRQAKL